MKYLLLKQPIAVFGRLVYPDAGVLMLDDYAEAQRILDAGQATDVSPEFEALTTAKSPAEEQTAPESPAEEQIAADKAKLAADEAAAALPTT